MRVKLTCKIVALDTANKVQDIIRLLTLRSVEEGDGEDVARLQPSSVRDADARARGVAATTTTRSPGRTTESV